MDLFLKQRKSMKHCSFKVAKAIKEAGYPQDTTEVYNDSGELVCTFPNENTYSAPTYLEVWLWLWREKDIEIAIDGDYCTVSYLLNVLYEKCYNKELCNPEEAIIAAIDYLVDNNLIQ